MNVDEKKKPFLETIDPNFGHWVCVSLLLHLVCLLLVKLIPVPERIQEIAWLGVEPSHSPRIVRLLPNIPREYFLVEGGPAFDLKVPLGHPSASGEEGESGKGRPGPRSANILGILNNPASHWAKLFTNPLPPDVGDKLKPTAPGRPNQRGRRYGVGDRGKGYGGGNPYDSTQTGYLPIPSNQPKLPVLGGREHGEPNVVAAIASEEIFAVGGKIPKEVIAKIMQDHIGRIRWCYERQVQKTPNLTGKITTQFIIGFEGTVTSSRIKHSSMKNRHVETCVQNVIKTLEFPKPGGGLVEVIYPFFFRVAG